MRWMNLMMTIVWHCTHIHKVKNFLLFLSRERYIIIILDGWTFKLKWILLLFCKNSFWFMPKQIFTVVVGELIVYWESCIWHIRHFVNKHTYTRRSNFGTCFISFWSFSFISFFVCNQYSKKAAIVKCMSIYLSYSHKNIPIMC